MSLKGKSVLMFVDDGYEDQEFWYPKLRLMEEGADVNVASTKKGIYKSKHGYEAKAEFAAVSINPSDYDCVIIPGGTVSADRLRRDKTILDIVRKSFEQGKVVAAICHGPWILISAGIVKGRKTTSFYSMKDDLQNAGAKYMGGKSVVVDGTLITSRQPEDLPYFCKAIINALMK